MDKYLREINHIIYEIDDLKDLISTKFNQAIREFSTYTEQEYDLKEEEATLRYMRKQINSI